MRRARSAAYLAGERRRAGEYQRALARLRDLHRDEFDQLYAEERSTQPQTDAAAR